MRILIIIATVLFMALAAYKCIVKPTKSMFELRHQQLERTLAPL